ncbi:MAG TPA: DEAD/DEAH box helicase, partial [Actinomycetaceae bacterium]|nr:DEAD/DEAH box helicase [Actinomycetaceae bacterium]
MTSASSGVVTPGDRPIDISTAADLEALDDAGIESVSTDITAEEDALTRTFADFGVSAPIVEALAEAGITHPFPIQALTLPVALAGGDIIGQAKTGTGKTLGFGIPLLERITGPGEEGWDTLPFAGKPQGLVVVPTR